jgi:hypothetical protein
MDSRTNFTIQENAKFEDCEARVRKSITQGRYMPQGNISFGEIYA